MSSRESAILFLNDLVTTPIVTRIFRSSRTVKPRKLELAKRQIQMIPAIFYVLLFKRRLDFLFFLEISVKFLEKFPWD